MSRLSQFIWIILSSQMMAACAVYPVSINSDPTAAMVFLNGEKLGRAPVKINLDRTKIQEAGTIHVPVKVVWVSGASFEGHLRLKSSLSQATFNVARPDVGGRYDDELFALKYQELQAQKAAVAAANSRRMMEAGLALMGGGAYSNSGSRDTSMPVGASRLPQGAYTLPTVPKPSAGYNVRTYQAVPQGAYTLPDAIPDNPPKLGLFNVPSITDDDSIGLHFCLKDREGVSGNFKNCVYSCSGSERVETIKRTELCPISFRR